MKVDYSEGARKQLKKLDTSVRKRILDYMDEVALLDNPRVRGKMLVGNLLGFWRYRIGAYRVLCKIIDTTMVIFVVDIGHRKEVCDG
ncbi:type II toxin-antitoxin system RelE/ParE family toxin [Treponema sp. OMZ 305]|uniref:type II toxin-antitoxin system RelE family toxin n=1 Tax=Treponema sp. OMZ 305 TaxID=1659192 RepID=UPI0020A30492|nr:type II toxin-antitoxin system RelE/ParE family toxin [Treponema sp. OMZ 305]UTC57551.1 type II toxin-antitoxin system RelE/ParE family toxin [Treponema sp. OMZ 305]